MRLVVLGLAGLGLYACQPQCEGPKVDAGLKFCPDDQTERMGRRTLTDEENSQPDILRCGHQGVDYPWEDHRRDFFALSYTCRDTQEQCGRTPAGHVKTVVRNEGNVAADHCDISVAKTGSIDDSGNPERCFVAMLQRCLQGTGLSQWQKFGHEDGAGGEPLKEQQAGELLENDDWRAADDCIEDEFRVRWATAEPNSDNDRVCDAVDNCPEQENQDQEDCENGGEGDGIGNKCDPDDDDDGVPDEHELSAGTNLCSTDSDGDGIPDLVELTGVAS